MKIPAAICCGLLFTLCVNEAIGHSGFQGSPPAGNPPVSVSESSASPGSRPANGTHTASALPGASANISTPVWSFPMAVRSNLLADVLLMPDVGIEIPIGEKFSVAADFTYAYWRLNNRFALQTIQGNLEGRYWFDWRWRNRDLTGWNVGLHVTFGGRYDIQWNDGWQGDRFTMVGVTGGYSMQISPKFNLDFSLGAGLIFTPEARRYTRPQDGHLIWKETRYDMTRFMLTRARVSLVWLFDITKKSKK